MRLTLVIPHLVWPEPDDQVAFKRLHCSSLEWLIGRSSFARQPALAYEVALAKTFGLDDSAALGPLRLLGEASDASSPDAHSGTWLCADPVHLRFHHERIILADTSAFDFSLDEANELAIGLNREFLDIGRFHVADTRRWYVQLQGDSSFAAPPLSAVAGRRVDGTLTGDSEDSRMRAWLNEIQMFLHGHPINTRRTGAGKPAINSLWFWGAGRLPESKKRAPDYNTAWAAEPIAVGLARNAGILAHIPPDSLDDILSQATARSSHLVVLDNLLSPVIYENSQGWREVMHRFENNWFAPLRATLGRAISQITLLSPTSYGLLTWEIGRGDRWKFWHKPMAIESLAKELAQ